jgi:transposase
MYIQRYRKKVAGRSYENIYLTRSYRENGKIKHEHIANLTKVPEQLLKALERELKGKASFSLEDLSPAQGKSYGGLSAIHQLCKQNGIDKALGETRQGRLSLVQIMGRILCQGSRNYIANQWSEDQAIEEVLGITVGKEDNLYDNLIWLSENQEAIEDKLFKIRHKSKETGCVYLYDVTSSYFEGHKNEYAEYGYNRDKKRGKKQIVIGMLCDSEGYPVSVEVFKGNTNDTTTVSSQLQKLKNRFRASKVVFVGDRGMIKSGNIDDITEEKWHYITAITRQQIQTLLDQGTIQMELFTEELIEVEVRTKVKADDKQEEKKEDNYTRYILRRNPVRAEEIRKNRNERIEKIKTFVQEKNTYLKEHPKAKATCALKDVNVKIDKLKISEYITISESNRILSVNIVEQNLENAKTLDGCYVIKSNIEKQDATKETIHNRYKDLSDVEWVFRTMKQSFEEVRPIYVRKKAQTRGHVFICMLAYIVIKTAWDACKELGIEQTAIFETLDKIQYVQYDVNGIKVKMLPKKFNQRQQQIIDMLNLKFPAYV